MIIRTTSAILLGVALVASHAVAQFDKKAPAPTAIAKEFTQAVRANHKARQTPWSVDELQPWKQGN